MPKTLALFASFEVLHTTQYAFHVLATPKLRQTDSSPRQATFFILEPCKLYANLKKNTQRRQVERESSTFRNQLPSV